MYNIVTLRAIMLFASTFGPIIFNIAFRVTLVIRAHFRCDFIRPDQRAHRPPHSTLDRAVNSRNPRVGIAKMTPFLVYKIHVHLSQIKVKDPFATDTKTWNILSLLIRFWSAHHQQPAILFALLLIHIKKLQPYT